MIQELKKYCKWATSSNGKYLFLSIILFFPLLLWLIYTKFIDIFNLIWFHKEKSNVK